ncbi:MAG: endo-1,4-beta-xylanase [Phycisphaerae bacterium]|nr:endo-1,4-beta-xylanase [Phycisphaerae bacterium]
MRFIIFKNRQPASVPDVESAYMVGQDGVPMRAQIADKRGEVQIRLRADGAAALCLLWDVQGFGRVMLQTTRLPERNLPYVLSVELLRHQIFLLSLKLEDWGLIDFPDAEPLTRQLDEIRDRFVDALDRLTDPAEASAIAELALSWAMQLGEQVAMYHSSLFLGRRVLTSSPHRREPTFGCHADLLSFGDDYRRRLAENFDFVYLPLSWKQIEPKEKELNWARVDSWVEWAVQRRLPIYAGPLLSFDERFLPDWLFLWEHDFDALRDLMYEHISQAVRRYRGYINTWTVTSGIAADNCFNLTFDQIIDMTRMAGTRTKQEDPKARTLIEVTWPWGVYHARSQRTIPPLLYADMVVQSGTAFDGLALQFYFGLGDIGFYVRDMLSMSAVLDKFANFAKPLHISAVQVPSDVSIDTWDAWGGAKSVEDGGQWRRPWDEALQAEWLKQFYALCLSKPYVRTVAWRDLADFEGHFLSHGGLLRATLEEKVGFTEYCRFRDCYHRRRRVRTLGMAPLDLSGPNTIGPEIFEEAAASAATIAPPPPRPED